MSGRKRRAGKTRSRAHADSLRTPTLARAGAAAGLPGDPPSPDGGVGLDAGGQTGYQASVRVARATWHDWMDLAGAAALALLAALCALSGAPLWLRLPLGLPAVLFLPGYGLTVALFPRREDLELVERSALAIGLSLALIAFLALALNASPWKLAFTPIVVSLTLCSLAGVGTGALRRRGVAPAERFSPAAAAEPWHPRHWRGASRASWLMAGALAGALSLAVVALAVTLTAPPPPATEFYILGPEGLAEGYPRSAAVGEPVRVTVGITNRERAALRYVVTATVAPMTSSTSSSLQQPAASPALAAVAAAATAGGGSGAGMGVGTPEQVGRLGPLPVASGETWEGPLTFTLPRAGRDQAVRIELRKDGQSETAEPYRALRLWLDVSAATPPRG